MRFPPLTASLARALLVAGLAGLPASPASSGQEPAIPPPMIAAPHPDKPPEADRPPDSPMSLRPLPRPAVPDDPPPHEGAMIDVPLVIEPPDIIVVEVLEARPGRPISGERLVRPDGTISLGFYGDVHVRGLTTEQAKAKIVLHLRKFLTDQVLGLIIFRDDPNGQGEPPMPAGEEPAAMPGEPPLDRPDAPKQIDPTPAQSAPPSAHRASGRPPRTNPRSARQATPARRSRIKTIAQVAPAPDQDVAPDDVAEAFRRQPRDPLPEEIGAAHHIHPRDTLRVFVDIISFNSKVYFVQGDVGTPGRLPITGLETVLDAMNYAGGLVPSADITNIHLYRPAQGGKPARDYPINFRAIQRGDAKANLQIFPNDRIVVGRDPIVQKTVEIDRAASPMNAVFNSALTQSFAVRSLGAAMGDLNGSTQAQRDEALKRWVEYLFQFPTGGAPLTPEQQTLRDSLLKKLDSRAEAKERAGIKE